MAAQHLKGAHETGIKIDSERIARRRRLHAAAYNRSAAGQAPALMSRTHASGILGSWLGNVH
jgi:hypothetical protein